MNTIKNGQWMSGASSVDDWMVAHKTVVSATTASLVSTFAGFPLDSLKSRLQSSKEAVSLPRLAADVVREEGIRGLWRGSLLPLVTIATVRTISFTIYSNTKRYVNGTSHLDLSSPSVDMDLLLPPTILSVASASLIAGAASGAVVCMGSCPFELVKVRRQLEYQIARERREVELLRAVERGGLVAAMDGVAGGAPGAEGAMHRHQSHGFDMVGQGDGEAQSGEEMKRADAQAKQRELDQHRKKLAAEAVAKTGGAAKLEAAGVGGPAVRGLVEAAAKGDIMAGWKPPGTLDAVKDIFAQRGVMGLWTGFRMHAIRDTLGTSLYFAEYDVFRYILGRDPRTDKQGEPPEWAKSWLPSGVIPFVCGSVAGVTSWALIYPVDAIKTKTQQRVLTGLPARPALVQLTRLVRGKDPNDPKPWLVGVSRLYRGLGISMLRSVINHGLLWTMVDAMTQWVDNRPFERYVASG